MAVLLSKFRIDYSDLVIISDFNEAPKTKTRKWFDNLIRPLLRPDENGIILTISKEINCINNETFSFKGDRITEEELEEFQYKTDRHLRLRDLLLDHSSDSNLVVM